MQLIALPLKTSLKPRRVILKKRRKERKDKDGQKGAEGTEIMASFWKLKSHGNWLSKSETAECKAAGRKLK